MVIKILPSLLAADFGRLADEARRAEAAGGDALHLDIMDGHFVPNLSFGPDVVVMSRRAVRMPLNVHLMLSRPQDFVDRFIEAGASVILIHVEADADVAATLDRIRAARIPAGLTLKPATPAAALAPYFDRLDMVLCMTVEPGYGGQSFMPDMLPKITAVRRMAQERGRGDLEIMVDGGITDATGAAAAAAGADALVAGSSLFRARDMAAAVAAMRQSAQAAYGHHVNA